MMLKITTRIFYKELLLLLRASHEWIYPLVFFVIMIILFPLALTPDPKILEKFIPGLTWIAALLASLLSIENIFFMDKEDGSLEQMLLSAIPLPLSVMIKISARWAVTILPLMMIIPILGLLFDLTLAKIFLLILSLLLGTPILILISSLGAALTLGLRQQGTLLGLLVLPLVIPVLIFSVGIFQQNEAGLFIKGPLAFLAGLLILAITVLPFAIAETLRIVVDE